MAGQNRELHFNQALARNLLSKMTVFGIAIVFCSQALAQTPQAVEQEYQACLSRAKEEFTVEERQKVQTFRALLRDQMAPHRADRSQSGVPRYSEALISLLENHIVPEEVTTRLYPRFKFAIAEEKLRRVVQQSLGLKHRDYLAYSKLAVGSVVHQQSLNLEKFQQAHETLLQTLGNWYRDEIDRNLGLKVPTALTMSRPEEFALAFNTTNEVSEIVAELQVVNAILARDQLQFKKALALQTAYAIGGTVAFMSTFALGPLAVARGGALALQLGNRAIQGARGAGMGVGALGTPGALAPLTAYITVTNAYRRSSELGTPVRCELDREAVLANFSGKMAGAAAFGTGVGLVGVSAVGMSMITLRVTGVMAVGGMTYNGGYAAYEGVKGYQFCRMGIQLRELTEVPEHLRTDQLALAKMADNECWSRLQMAGRHSIEGATIFALYRELYIKGHLREALEHGATKAMGVMAYSADSIPTALKTTAEAGTAVAVTVTGMIRGPQLRQVAVPLAQQIQLFLAKFPRSNPAEVSAVEWNVALP